MRTASSPPHPATALSPSRWASFAPAALLLAFSALASLAAGLAPVSGSGMYAVVAPPWYDLQGSAGLVGRAGGEIVDAGGLGNVLIVHSAQPAFIRALYHAGAWLVLDPTQLRGCLGFRADPQPQYPQTQHGET